MRQPPTLMEITGILETTAKGIRVIRKKTGRPLWLPREGVEYLPGAVKLPAWLAEKIFNRGRNHEHPRHSL